MRFTTFGFSAYAKKISNIFLLGWSPQWGSLASEDSGATRYNCGKQDTYHVMIDKTIRVDPLCTYVMSTNIFSTGDINTVPGVYIGLRKICKILIMRRLAYAAMHGPPMMCIPTPATYRLFSSFLEVGARHVWHRVIKGHGCPAEGSKGSSDVKQLLPLS
ncbi:hypothetical protein ANPL_04245 [Anaplasma platys]|uniref:Uncharacterized protein n=1 Tax=Anaplasma platys TaxID=949 RepID=A0A858PZ66_9RICK|nr:hypothetical protein ANPL_04245 [Anaplasma platys]